MSRQDLHWECAGPSESWCARLRELLPAIGENLDLGDDFQRICICADPSPAEEACWLRLLPCGPEGSGLLELELFCSAGSLARPQAAGSTVFPAPQVWDAREGAWSAEGFDAEAFSPRWAQVFLYHNLLLARDLARREINPAAIPTGQVEAFEAAWEVVVDGRLSRAGLPGYSLAERRGRFSRLFSSAGVLMPDHWQVFQSLWDGGLATGRDVLAVIRQLPRL